MKKWLSVYVVLVLLAFHGYSLADDEEKEEKSSITMEEVVVTATRTGQSVEKVPANVTVISQEDIKNSNARTVTDLLRSEEGIVVRDLLGHGKTAQVDLRGYGETGPYNTLVLVDGRRVNEIDLSGVDWTQIPLEQLERIEIVRGTGSVLYGDSAVGGVINIITKIPSEKFTAKTGITFGSYKRHKEEIYVSGGHERILASLFASRNETDGYRDNNEYSAQDVGGKIIFDTSDFISLNFSGSYHKDDYDLPGPLTEAELDDNRKDNVNPLDEGASKDYYLKTGFDLAVGKFGNVITDFSYRHRTSEADYPDPTGVFPQAFDTDTGTYGITPQFIWDGNLFGHKNALVAGMDFYWSEQDVNSFGGFGIPLTTKTGISNIERDSWGIYIHNEDSIRENIILSFGARYEEVRYDLIQIDLNDFPLTPLDEEITESDYAYSVGLTFLYGIKSSFFIRTNRSIRFPLTDEVVYIDWSTFAIRANTDLEPQAGIHYDIGIKHYFTPYIRGSLTLFWAEIDNELFYNPITFSNENHPKTLHQGVEIGSKATFFDMITLFGNLTYEDATFAEDPYKNNDIPATPKYKANLGFRIHDVVPGLIFSANYNFVDESYVISDQANNFEELEEHYSIDARLSYEMKMIKAFVGVNNITNQKYSEYAVMDTFLTERNFYPAPERNWVVGAQVTF
jgi:iron complex outermembrane receptor protein